MNIPAYDPRLEFVNSLLSHQQQRQQNALLRNQVEQLPTANALSQEGLKKAQITNQFLPQSLQTKMALEQAQALFNQAHAQNLPLQNQLGWAKLDQEKKNYSPEYLALRNAQLRQLVQHDERFGSSFTKDQIAALRTANGLLPTGATPTVESLQTTGYNQSFPTPPPMPQQNALQGQGTPAPNNALANQPQQQQQQLPPDVMQAMANQYQMKTLKSAAPAQVLNRNLFATNIDKTLDFINPQVLTSYSGPQGALKLAQDKASAIAGRPSKDFLAYSDIVNTYAPMLATQIRQFYGDSVQPAVQDKLAKLANPNAWSKNPQEAISNYMSLVKTLKAEMKTYRQAAAGVDAYKEQPSKAQSQAAPQNQYTQEEIQAEIQRRKLAK